MHSPATITVNIGAFFGNTVVRRLMSFVVTLSVARYLSLDDFGKYVLALATMEMFRSIADFGIDIMAVRRLARTDADRGSVITSALGLKAVLSVPALGAALVTALSLGYSSELMAYVAIASLYMYLNTTTLTLATYFQASLRVKRLIPVNWSASALALGLVWLGMLLEAPVAGLLAAAAAAEAYGASLTLLVLRREIKLRWRRDLRLAWSLLREAAPIGVLSILTCAYFRVDILMLSQFTGETDVAHYGAIFRITEATLAIASAIALTLLPLMSSAFAQGKSQARISELFEKGFRWLLAASVVIASLLTLFSLPVLRLLYGARFGPASDGLAILAWSTVFMSLNILSAMVLVALNQQNVLILFAGFALALNVGLNLVLIPKFGLAGACATTVATEAVNTGLQMAWLARRLPARRLVSPTLKYGLLAIGTLILYQASGGGLTWAAAPAVALAYGAAALLLADVTLFGAGRRFGQLVLARISYGP